MGSRLVENGKTLELFQGEGGDIGLHVDATSRRQRRKRDMAREGIDKIPLIWQIVGSGGPLLFGPPDYARE
jgi:hypothetical protein